MLETLRKSFAMLPPASRRRWAMLVPLALVTAALEAGAAASVLALIQVIADSTRIPTLPVVSRIAAALPWSDAPRAVLAFTALVMVYQVVKNLLLLAVQHARYRVVAASRASLACTMLRSYLAAPYAFHLRRNSADLYRNATRLPQVVCGEVLSPAAALVSEALVTIAIATVLVWTAPAVTLIAGAVILTLLAVMLGVTRVLAVRLGGRAHELHREIDRDVQQAIGGVKEIKCCGAKGSSPSRSSGISARWSTWACSARR